MKKIDALRHKLKFCQQAMQVAAAALREAEYDVCGRHGSASDCADRLEGSAAIIDMWIDRINHNVENYKDEQSKLL